MNTIRAEFIKLRTVLVHWVLTAVAFLFPIVIITLISIFGDFGDADGLSRDVAEVVSGTAVVTALLLSAMAAISLTAEYAHSTIRPTFAATPSRLRVYGAKICVISGALAAVAALTVFASWFLAQLIFAIRDRSISLGSEGAIKFLLGAIVLCVLVGWFGFGLGLIIRNSPATVTMLMLWPLLVEAIILPLVFNVAQWEGANKYLPYSAAITAVGDNTDDNVFGRPWGFVYFAAVSLALIGLGGFLDNRRDA